MVGESPSDKLRSLYKPQDIADFRGQDPLLLGLGEKAGWS